MYRFSHNLDVKVLLLTLSETHHEIIYVQEKNIMHANRLLKKCIFQTKLWKQLQFERCTMTVKK